MENKEYKELLKDPRWQKMKALVMIRDNFTCQHCGATDKTLHVHHLKYNGAPWDVAYEDLITLCEDCHKEVHSVEEKKEWSLSEWDLQEYLESEHNDDLLFSWKEARNAKKMREREDIQSLLKKGLLDGYNLITISEDDIQEVIKKNIPLLRLRNEESEVQREPEPLIHETLEDIKNEYASKEPYWYLIKIGLLDKEDVLEADIYDCYEMLETNTPYRELREEYLSQARFVCDNPPGKTIVERKLGGYTALFFLQEDEMREILDRGIRCWDYFIEKYNEIPWYALESWEREEHAERMKKIYPSFQCL